MTNTCLLRATQPIRDLSATHMKDIIKNEELFAKPTPNFEIGCCRYTPGDHYLLSLQQVNVEVISNDIVQVTETGITDDTGVGYEVDVLVCVTGFDTTYEPRFPIIERDWYSLAKNRGKQKPTESYMGAIVARFPNIFVFCPPISLIVGSAFPGIAGYSDYILRALNRLQNDSLSSITFKESVFDIVDDIDGGYAGEKLQQLMKMRLEAGDFLQGWS